ncbi:putative ABC transport system ATP-binding protein [Desulfotomaculum arcticum]|uniref:Putative ABC transport system ATP-binding protein n=1 Tax=Desulfotruncus arcticus DSM 17038 TaxID=1121424 RepID=A0A1I2U793_9FIRM|nr:putative ABC transport system ATP-binding protein [Desulfotomaculum arcticum] [Desulfotruncus arcticus DSM 17038]
MIQVSGLTKIYNTGAHPVPALQDVNLEVKAGEFVSVMGPSGSGKSTLMNLLGCLDTPTSGSYQLDGIEISSLDDTGMAKVRNLKIGFVFQNFNLLPRMTALRNVELPMLYAGIDVRERVKRATAALERVGLAQRVHHRPNQMSGGQVQRVAIARSLVNRPAVLLADEPTGNLDTRSGEEIMAIFQDLNRGGATIVLVTHERDIALHTSRIIHFRDGRLVEDERVEKPLDALEVLKSLGPVDENGGRTGETPASNVPAGAVPIAPAVSDPDARKGETK